MNLGATRNIRRELAELLATKSAAVHFWVAERQASLPERLGVAAELLDEAADIVRHGFRKKSHQQALRARIDMHVPTDVAHAFEVLAAQLSTTPLGLGRSILHTAMLLPREPARRTGRSWGPYPGCEARRQALLDAWNASPMSYRQSLKRPDRFHMKLVVSNGLAGALDLRARRYGVTRHHYIVLWYADLVDGLLADIPLALVDPNGMFDDPAGYVLPAAPAGLADEPTQP